MAASEPATKTQDVYKLIYWPGFPGRGEHIRVLLEVAGVPYTDTAQDDGVHPVLSQISTENLGDENNPPILAPPILVHGSLTISQTPNILLYLAKRHNLIGSKDDENAEYKINELVLTTLDGFSNEVHDVHHPISIAAYYEDQIPEAKKKAADYISNRLPKFLGYFERVLSGLASGGEFLHGGSLTVADLVLWQCLDGLRYAFPNAMRRVEKEGKFGKVFKLYERITEMERVKAYLESGRRQKYGMGIYRYYKDLDEE